MEKRLGNCFLTLEMIGIDLTINDECSVVIIFGLFKDIADRCRTFQNTFDGQDLAIAF